MNLADTAASLGWTITVDDTDSGPTFHAREVTLVRGAKWMSLHTYVVSHRTWLPPFRFRARQVYAETSETAQQRNPLIEWVDAETRLPADPTDPDIDATVDRELTAMFTLALNRTVTA